jgi:hypothetical protein
MLAGTHMLQAHTLAGTRYVFDGLHVFDGIGARLARSLDAAPFSAMRWPVSQRPLRPNASRH